MNFRLSKSRVLNDVFFLTLVFLLPLNLPSRADNPPTIEEPAIQYLNDFEKTAEQNLEGIHSGIDSNKEGKYYISKNEIPKIVKTAYRKITNEPDKTWPNQGFRIELSKRSTIYAFFRYKGEHGQQFLYLLMDRENLKVSLLNFPFELSREKWVMGHSFFQGATGSMLLKVSNPHFSESRLWYWDTQAYIFQMHGTGAQDIENPEFEKIEFTLKLEARTTDEGSSPWEVSFFKP